MQFTVVQPRGRSRGTRALSSRLLHVRAVSSSSTCRVRADCATPFRACSPRYSTMTLCSEAAAKSTQEMRKLQRPRPLHASLGSDAQPAPMGSPSDAAVLWERHQAMFAAFRACFDDCGADIPIQIDYICNLMKERGADKEKTRKEQLDRLFVHLRDACLDNHFSDDTRTKICEVIELRAVGWTLADDAEDCSQNGGAETSESLNAVAHPLTRPHHQKAIVPAVPSTPAPPSARDPSTRLGSHDFINDLGWSSPKDEMVVPSGDPGKGSSSFQNSLGQNAGLEEAHTTVEKTAGVISQCAVPLAEDMWSETTDALGSSGDFQEPLLVSNWSGHAFNMLEYASTVTVGRETIHITGANSALVGTAALLVKEYFSSHLKNADDEVAANSSSTAYDTLTTALENIVLSDTSRAPRLHTETPSLQKVAVPKHTGSLKSAASKLRTAFGTGGSEMDDAHSPPYEQSSTTPVTEILCKESNFAVRGPGGLLEMQTNVSAYKNDLQGVDELSPFQNRGSSWNGEQSMPSRSHAATGPHFETVLPCGQEAKKTPTYELKHSSWPSTMKSLPVQPVLETLQDTNAPVETKGYKIAGSSQELSSFFNNVQRPSPAIHTPTATCALKHAACLDTMRSLWPQAGSETLRHGAPTETKANKTPGSSKQFSSLSDGNEAPLSAIHAQNLATWSDDTMSLPMQTSYKAMDHGGAAVKTKVYKTTGSSQGYSSSVDQDSQEFLAPDSSCGMQSKRKRYTRDFLFQCAHSSLATKVPADFPRLDPTVASVMVKAHHSMSDK